MVLKHLFMKSRISIDLDFDNQPIIKIEYSYSPDARDTMVKRFIETFHNQTSWTKITFTEVSEREKGNVYGEGDCACKIRPLGIKELCNEHIIIEEMVDKYNIMLSKL